MRGFLVGSGMILLLGAAPAEAQPARSGEWQEEFRDGPCLIKRKQDKSGAYKEEIKCEGGRYANAPKYSEEFYQGLCKIVRKQEPNGEYFFERDCKAPG
jgi:hypothetical protein